LSILIDFLEKNYKYTNEKKPYIVLYFGSEEIICKDFKENFNFCEKNFPIHEIRNFIVSLPLNFDVENINKEIETLKSTFQIFVKNPDLKNIQDWKSNMREIEELKYINEVEKFKPIINEIKKCKPIMEEMEKSNNIQTQVKIFSKFPIYEEKYESINIGVKKFENCKYNFSKY
jgi:hypothetical protein